MSDQGTFWLSRYKTGTNLYYPDRCAFDLATYLADLPTDAPQEVDVLMGDVHHFKHSLTLARQVVRHYSWSMARYLWDTQRIPWWGVW